VNADGPNGTHQEYAATVDRDGDRWRVRVHPDHGYMPGGYAYALDVVDAFWCWTQRGALRKARREVGRYNAGKLARSKPVVVR
jgi:hypothetical protein